jgi:hypothetical protein
MFIKEVNLEEKGNLRGDLRSPLGPIDWQDIQALTITRFVRHDDDCPALTLLDSACNCGLLDKLILLRYPGAKRRDPAH